MANKTKRDIEKIIVTMTNYGRDTVEKPTYEVTIEGYKMSNAEILKNYKLRFPWTEKDLNELVERYETRLFLTSEKIIRKLVNYKIIEKK